MEKKTTFNEWLGAFLRDWRNPKWGPIALDGMFETAVTFEEWYKISQQLLPYRERLYVWRRLTELATTLLQWQKVYEVLPKDSPLKSLAEKHLSDS